MLTRRKRYLFYALLVLAIYLILEIASFSLYAAVKRKWFAFEPFWLAQRTLSESAPFKYRPSDVTTMYFQDNVLWGNIYEAVHPYLGFVHDPRKMKAHSEYGFPGEHTPFVQKTDQNLIIGILGGSFAEQTATLGKEALIRTLRQSADFATKDIVILPLALGGYKQPQQLLTLTYFLALGAHFDLIINIDGFNEVALSPTENIPYHVNPFYPRSWAMRMHAVGDSETLLRLGKTALLYERQQTLAHLFVTTPLRYSITGNVAWGYYNRYLANHIVRYEQTIQQAASSDSATVNYSATGPAYQYKTDDDMYRALAEFWMQCSVQLARLCASNQIAYHHVLQPNQYVAGSKLMSAEERTLAILDTHPYRRPVELGYPHLKRLGPALREAGVQFTDLTMIFAENADVLYADNMCHLNARGYELIGVAVGSVVLDSQYGGSQ